MCKKRNYFILKRLSYSNISPFKIDSTFSFDVYDDRYLGSVCSSFLNSILLVL